MKPTPRLEFVRPIETSISAATRASASTAAPSAIQSVTSAERSSLNGDCGRFFGFILSYFLNFELDVASTPGACVQGAPAFLRRERQAGNLCGRPHLVSPRRPSQRLTGEQLDPGKLG